MNNNLDRMMINTDNPPPHYCKALHLEATSRCCLGHSQLQFGKDLNAFTLVFKSTLGITDFFMSTFATPQWTKLNVYLISNGNKTLIDVFVKIDDLANELGLNRNTIIQWSQSNTLEDNFHCIRSKAREIHQIFPTENLSNLRRICGYIEENLEEWQKRLSCKTKEILKIKKDDSHHYSVYIARKNTSKKYKCFIHLGKKHSIGSGIFKEVTKIIDYDALRIHALAKTLLTDNNQSVTSKEEKYLKMFPASKILLQSQHIASVKGKQYIVMPFCELGDLWDNCYRNDDYQKLTDKEIDRIALNLMKGVLELHRNNFIHQDLKPENIFLYTQGRRGITKLYCKISDFGFTKKITGGLLKIRGTLEYFSPEKIKNIPIGYLEDKLGAPSDVWALGIVFNLLFFNNKLYFDDPGFDTHFKEIITKMPHLMAAMIEFYMQKTYPEPDENEALEHLIWEMLRIDPMERITIKEAYPRLRKILRV